MKQETVTQLDQAMKQEPLSEEILRTATAIDPDRHRLSADDRQKVEFYVECMMREHFRSCSEESRSDFELDKKVLDGQIAAFLMSPEGFAEWPAKAKKAKSLALDLAQNWQVYFQNSQILKAWTESYLEFKQNVR